LLIEQRPSAGMWGGLWQAPTIESKEGPPTARKIGAELGLEPRGLRPESSFEHRTTHRRVVFQVWRAEAVGAGFTARRGLWMGAEAIERLGMSNAQRRILRESVQNGTLFS
jgi:A/G-specific adenine glycosylase